MTFSREMVEQPLGSTFDVQDRGFPTYGYKVTHKATGRWTVTNCNFGLGDARVLLLNAVHDDVLKQHA